MILENETAVGQEAAPKGEMTIIEEIVFAARKMTTMMMEMVMAIND